MVTKSSINIPISIPRMLDISRHPKFFLAKNHQFSRWIPHFWLKTHDFSWFDPSGTQVLFIVCSIVASKDRFLSHFASFTIISAFCSFYFFKQHLLFLWVAATRPILSSTYGISRGQSSCWCLWTARPAAEWGRISSLRNATTWLLAGTVYSKHIRLSIKSITNFFCLICLICCYRYVFIDIFENRLQLNDVSPLVVKWNSRVFNELLRLSPSLRSGSAINVGPLP